MSEDDKPNVVSPTKGQSNVEWPEIKKVFEGKRYELILNGTEISDRIDKCNGELPDSLFKLKHLNLLEIARTNLKELPTKIEFLENLTSLILHSNKLVAIPNELGKLKTLNHLDLSNNQIVQLPEDLQNLTELKTLNVSGNNLTALFPLGQLSKLAILNLSRNKFTELPSDLGSEALENLSEINVSFNQLDNLDSNLSDLPSLKSLNLEHNQIKEVPADLSLSPKLKEILLHDNKLKDNRLKKLVEQNKQKPIIEYLERIHQEECKKEAKTPTNKSEKSNKGRKSDTEANKNVEYDVVKVLHFNINDEKLYSKEVFYGDSVVDIRPHIVCCIVRNLDLKSGDNLKKFLALQTKLHEDTCQKRTLGTIATHDLSLIKGNLFYEAIDPDLIEFMPLGRSKSTTASEYFRMLYDEAEAERKLKKRNQLSGIYKYLSLLENKEVFPVVRDAENNVISLPPLSNSNNSRMSTDTKDILIEITSTTNIEFCKKLMEELLIEMLNLKLCSIDCDEVLKKIVNDVKTLDLDSSAASNEKASLLRQTMYLQQVKILNSKGSLKGVYPSRIDLKFNNSNSIKVHRLYEEP